MLYYQGLGYTNISLKAINYRLHPIKTLTKPTKLLIKLKISWDCCLIEVSDLRFYFGVVHKAKPVFR